MKKNIKKMDVDSYLNEQINLLQAELFKKFRVKIKIQEITNTSITCGLPLAKELISKKLQNELIISPINS